VAYTSSLDSMRLLLRETIFFRIYLLQRDKDI
jgi:hypothetical protein